MLAGGQLKERMRERSRGGWQTGNYKAQSLGLRNGGDHRGKYHKIVSLWRDPRELGSRDRSHGAGYD